MAKVFPNRAWMTTATTGTGTITLGAAQPSYLTFAEAGVANADTADYTILDGANFESGVGTYTSAGTTFSRDTVTVSKIAGTAGTSKISLSGTATIFLTQLSAEVTGHMRRIATGSFTAVALLAFTGLSAYRYLELHVNGSRPANDGVALELYLSNDGGSSYTAGNISWGDIQATSAAAVIGDANIVTAADAFRVAGQAIGNAAGEGVWAIVKISNFNVAGQKVLVSTVYMLDTASAAYIEHKTGYDQASLAMNAFKIQYSAGDIAAIGTYDLFGMA